MKALEPIQKEIAATLEQLKDKSLITEAILAKKIRENAKIQGKNKAGICLKDLEACIDFLAEDKQLFFSIHVNSANDLLIKREDSSKPMDAEAKKRRQSSEKSISILTSGDLRGKSSGGKDFKKRTDRKKLSPRNFEED